MFGFKMKLGSIRKIIPLDCGLLDSKLREIQQLQFEYTYLFGAVCPSTGKTEALITPFANKAE